MMRPFDGQARSCLLCLAVMWATCVSHGSQVATCVQSTPNTPKVENPRSLTVWLPDRYAVEIARDAVRLGAPRDDASLAHARFVKTRDASSQLADRGSAELALRVAIADYARELKTMAPSLDVDARAIEMSMLRSAMLVPRPDSHRLLELGDELLVDKCWATFVTESSPQLDDAARKATIEAIAKWKTEIDQQLESWIPYSVKLAVSFERGVAEGNTSKVRSAIAESNANKVKWARVSLRAIDELAAHLEPEVRTKWCTFALQSAFRSVLPRESACEGLAEVAMSSMDQEEIRDAIRCSLGRYRDERLRHLRAIAAASSDQAIEQSGEIVSTPSVELSRAIGRWIANEDVWIMRISNLMPPNEAEKFRLAGRRGMNHILLNGGEVAIVQAYLQEKALGRPETEPPEALLAK